MDLFKSVKDMKRVQVYYICKKSILNVGVTMCDITQKNLDIFPKQKSDEHEYESKLPLC